MKKIILTWACSLMLLTAGAQTYTFSRATGEYSHLVDDTVISTPNWVGQRYFLRLPFDIRVSNVNFRDLLVSTDGTILRRISSTQASTIATMCGAVGLRQNKGIDSSQISYVIEGEAPNRIAKIQYKNVGFVGDERHLDHANFQVWFYEGQRRIEFHYGPSDMVVARAFNGGYGPRVGCAGVFIRGNENSPATTNANVTLNGMPAPGTIYRFVAP